MAGVNHLKKGKHPSRGDVSAHISEAEFTSLFKQVSALLDHHKPGLQEFIWLTNAIATARADNLRAQICSVTLNDTRRQLQCMLKLNDSALIEALRNCDEKTLLEVNEAQEALIWEMILANGVFIDAEGKEYASSSHPICFDPINTLPCLPMGLDGTRTAIQRALATVQANAGVRGPKHKKHHADLARKSIAFWKTYRPHRSPGRLAFIALIFNAANIYLCSKRLEALMAAAEQ